MITYLDKKEMDALLNLPDKQTEQGWRDYVLLLFLYNTGARAEEAVTLQVKDLFIPKGKGIPVVTMQGKEAKLADVLYGMILVSYYMILLTTKSQTIMSL